MSDPGWRPAVAVAWRVLTLRPPEASILMVMRGAVIFLSVAGAVAAVVAIALGAGSQEPRIEEATARIVLGLAVAVGAITLALIGRSGPDVRSQGHLAVSVFRATMLRVLAVAAVQPAGLALSWASGDPAYVIFGTGAAILLMAVGGPTRDRLGKWQELIDESGSDLSLQEALSAPYHTR